MIVTWTHNRFQVSGFTGHTWCHRCLSSQDTHGATGDCLLRARKVSQVKSFTGHTWCHMSQVSVFSGPERCHRWKASQDTYGATDSRSLSSQDQKGVPGKKLHRTHMVPQVTVFSGPVLFSPSQKPVRCSTQQTGQETNPVGSKDKEVSLRCPR